MAKRIRRSCPHGLIWEECEDCCMMSVDINKERGAGMSMSMHTDMDMHQQEEKRRRKKPNGEIDADQQCCMFAHSLPAKKAARNNSMRLSEALFSRVPNRLYPDATKYGWQFTGSCERGRAEFFEKEDEHGTILLDFYITAGTIKVVLIRNDVDHNDEDEEIQLFAKGRSLLPDIYVKVLQNPLVYTDLKYRRRS